MIEKLKSWFGLSSNQNTEEQPPPSKYGKNDIDALMKSGCKEPVRKRPINKEEEQPQPSQVEKNIKILQEHATNARPKRRTIHNDNETK